MQCPTGSSFLICHWVEIRVAQEILPNIQHLVSKARAFHRSSHGMPPRFALNDAFLGSQFVDTRGGDWWRVGSSECKQFAGPPVNIFLRPSHVDVEIGEAIVRCSRRAQCPLLLASAETVFFCFPFRILLACQGSCFGMSVLVLLR